MKRLKFILMVSFIICITTSHYFARDSGVNDDNLLVNVSSLANYLDDQSAIKMASGQVSQSNLFTKTKIDGVEVYQLNDLGIDVVGQSLIYKGIEYEDENIKYNIKLSITDAKEVSGTSQYITFSKDEIVVKGYSNIGFKLEFLSVDSAKPLEVMPIMVIENADRDTSLKLKTKNINNIILQSNSNIDISSIGDETVVNFETRKSRKNDVAVANKFGESFSFDLQFANTSNEHRLNVNPYLREKSGQLSVKAVTDNGVPVSNASYVLEDEKGNEVGNYTTDYDGNAIIDDIKYGQYALKDSGKANFVRESRDTTYISITEKNTYVPISIVYNSEKSQIGTIVLHVEGGRKGDTYYIYDEDGNIVDNLVLDENGNASSNGLAYGNYIVVGDGGSAHINLNKGIVFTNFDLTESNESVNQNKPNVTTEINNDASQSIEKTVETNYNEMVVSNVSNNTLNRLMDIPSEISEIAQEENEKDEQSSNNNITLPKSKTNVHKSRVKYVFLLLIIAICIISAIIFGILKKDR